MQRSGWLALLLLAGAVGTSLLWYVANWWTSPLPVNEAVTVSVRDGDTAGTVAARLADAGLLKRPRLLRWSTQLYGLAGSLKVGEYRVWPGDTPQRLMLRIVGGEVVPYRFRIVEGTRIATVLAGLRAESKLVDTLDKVTAENLMRVLGIETATGADHAEGWFFPDTYHFVAGDTDRDLLLRAHLKMREELELAWVSRGADLPYPTPYDVLIVASIIEKETGRPADRNDVSQVIAARIRTNMRLQVDPTVIYGLGAAFDGNLTRAHLKQPTPYNTYVHKGLPPTPIALPGREALQAAVHPSGAPYLYFVSRGDGSSQFSTTLEEHLVAVNKYQRKGD